ncbi:hypothetical protein OSTOST_11433 [Ostertagia ostertagi]
MKPVFAVEVQRGKWLMFGKDTVPKYTPDASPHMDSDLMDFVFIDIRLMDDAAVVKGNAGNGVRTLLERLARLLAPESREYAK